MDAQKQVTVKVGSDTKQTKPTKKATKPACDVNKEIQKAKEENKRTMNLSKCNLQIIPNSIKELTNLVELFLYGNKIAVLPPEIGQLTQLTTLAVRMFQSS